MLIALNVIIFSNDGDDVETHFLYNIEHLDILVGCVLKIEYLLPVNSILRQHGLSPGARLDFDEDYHPAVGRVGYDVQVMMTAWRPPICPYEALTLPVHNTKSVAFSPFADIVVLCHMFPLFCYSV